MFPEIQGTVEKVRPVGTQSAASAAPHYWTLLQNSQENDDLILSGVSNCEQNDDLILQGVSNCEQNDDLILQGVRNTSKHTQHWCEYVTLDIKNTSHNHKQDQIVKPTLIKQLPLRGQTSPAQPQWLCPITLVVPNLILKGQHQQLKHFEAATAKTTLAT